MADRKAEMKAYRQSGAHLKGIGFEEYKLNLAEQNKLLKEQDNLVKKLAQKGVDANTRIQEQGKLQSYLNGTKLEEKLIAEKLLEIEKEDRDLNQQDIDDIKTQVAQQKKLGTAVNQIFPGAVSFATGIEDAAEGIGAKYKNRKAGTFGEISLFSFFYCYGFNHFINV